MPSYNFLVRVTTLGIPTQLMFELFSIQIQVLVSPLLGILGHHLISKLHLPTARYIKWRFTCWIGITPDEQIQFKYMKSKAGHYLIHSKLMPSDRANILYGTSVV